MTLLQYGPNRTAARGLVQRFEPVAWAYLQLGRLGLDERHSQVRVIRERLAADGASARCIEALADRLRHAPVAPATLAVFADADGTILHDQTLAFEQFDDVAGYSSPADVSALLAADQVRPPFVCAVVDRVGADITYASGGDSASRAVSVTGPDDDIRHNAPGGWASLSQSRFEHRAQDSWRHNARRVAERVEGYAAKVDAQAVIIFGEERVTGLVSEAMHLPDVVLVERLDGSRAADRDRATHTRRLRESLARVADRQTAQLLDTLVEELGTDRAVQGVSETVSALAAGRVSTLLVDPVAAARDIFFSAGATELWTDHDDAMQSMRPIESARLARVAIRAALLSGARVRILPTKVVSAPVDGIGAVCRFGATS